MEKILSIVIPTYNMEKYLSRCLSSLVLSNEELMRELEVLIIIDGATDDSSIIGHSFQEKFPNTFRVIDKQNGNYGSCINVGLSESRGKYIKILDADDYFRTNDFEKYLSILIDLNVDLVFTGFEFVDSEDRSMGLKKRGFTPGAILHFSDIIGDLNRNLVSMHELTYRTSNLRDINYHQTEGISYTDLEWCFFPITTVQTVYYSDLIVYEYLIGREGQTISPREACKNISHKIKSSYVMAQQFESINKTDSDHLFYLQNRISWSIGSIYYNYLISYYKDLEIKDLVAFDEELKNYPHVYDILNEVHISNRIHYNYIYFWRKHGRNNSFFIVFYRGLSKVLQRIKQ